MRLYRDVKPGDVIKIGLTTITVGKKSGGVTRLQIDSPEHVTLPEPVAAPVVASAVPVAAVPSLKLPQPA
jgi:hypothetical protein